MKVPFAEPTVGEDEAEEVSQAVTSGWITTGPRTEELEDRFRDRVDAPAATALSSCTAGLHLALEHLGVGPGDEVVTTPMTFASTANVIERVGARPRFVDVRPDTLNIDETKIEAAVSDDTAAILPVHYTGHPAELDAIQDVADDNDLPIVEDAAHGLPARYKGMPIGGTGNPTSFSFYATKNLTTGEGGMLAGPEALVEEASRRGLHGVDKGAWAREDEAGDWAYDVPSPGYKYNMTDIQAAMGLVQLDRLDEFQMRREEIWNRYDEAFEPLAPVETPTVLPHVDHARHLYVLRPNDSEAPLDRDEFVEELGDRGIGTSVHFIPIHLFSYYENKYGYEPEGFPVAYREFQRIVSLPLHPKLADDEVDYVIDNVREVLTKP